MYAATVLWYFRLFSDGIPVKKNTRFMLSLSLDAVKFFKTFWQFSGRLKSSEFLFGWFYVDYICLTSQ